MDNSSELPSPAEAPRLPYANGTRCTPHHTVSVIANAAPDLDAGTPGIQVVAGTLMQLSGSSEEIILTADCDVTENDLPFSWSLTLRSK